MFFKIRVRKISLNFTGKHLCWSLFLIKLQALGLQLYLYENATQVFSCEICKIFKTTFFTEHHRSLLLCILIHDIPRSIGDHIEKTAAVIFNEQLGIEVSMGDNYRSHGIGKPCRHKQNLHLLVVKLKRCNVSRNAFPNKKN